MKPTIFIKIIPHGLLEFPSNLYPVLLWQYYLPGIVPRNIFLEFTKHNPYNLSLTYTDSILLEDMVSVADSSLAAYMITNQ